MNEMKKDFCKFSKELKIKLLFLSNEFFNSA